MNHRLTENKRGLLSAYLDGELQGVDRQEAERLLAESDDARRYLEELKAVEDISSRALTAPLSADAMIIATRLTGSSVKTAAGSAGLKAGLLGSWGTLGIGGLVTAAAVTVGVMIWPGRQSTTDSAPSTRHPYLAGMQGTPVVNLDSSSVIVPLMTAGELATFAVDGTLPIDAARERFITVASRSADSLAVALHAGTSRSELVREFARLTPSAIPSYDSLMRISRLAVLRSNDGAIAVSPTVPQLRLRILQSLARLENSDVTPTCRTRIARAEEELAVACAQRNSVETDHESFDDLVAALDGKRESPYILISTPDGGLLRATNVMQTGNAPIIVAIDLTDGPAVRVTPNSCRAIGRYAFAELPSRAQVESVAALIERGPQTISISAGSGERGKGFWEPKPIWRNRARALASSNADTDARSEIPPMQREQERASPDNVIPDRAAAFEELNRQIRERIRKVRDRVHRMDQALQEAPRSSEGDNINDDRQGGAGGDD